MDRYGLVRLEKRPDRTLNSPPTPKNLTGPRISLLSTVDWREPIRLRYLNQRLDPDQPPLMIQY
jgi:hypothetical protein